MGGGGGGGGGGGEGELNGGGGGMTPISPTAMDRSGMSSMLAAEAGSMYPPLPSGSPMAPGWLGVTRSLGSIDNGFTYFEPENRTLFRIFLILRCILY